MSQHRTIAPRTRKQINRTLSDVFARKGTVFTQLDMDDIIDAIDTGFVVKRRQELDAIKYADLEAGQVWRNRQSRRLARIDMFIAGDVHWTNIDGTPGPKSGETWRPTFLQKYEYVPERRGLN